MNPALLGYGVAAGAYTVLTALLVITHAAVGKRRHWLLFAAAGAMVWGIVTSVSIGTFGPGPNSITYGVDILRTLLWTGCLLGALPAESRRDGAPRYLWLGAILSAVAGIVLPQLGGTMSSSYVALLGLSIIGCVSVEQIFRNSTVAQKRVLKPFLWTVTVVFGYDLFMFAEAALYDAVDPTLWMLRGFVAAAAVPPLVLAAKRQPDWAETLFISRQVVFYSATLTGIGIYLLAMAFAAEVIRELGGQWSALVQLVFFAAALVTLVLVLSSARIRGYLRVWINKHFFRNRYEYRDEWLRLIRTLTGSDLGLPLEQRGVKALADIVESQGGQIWLARDQNSSYEPFAAWGAPFPSGEFARTSSLVRFLAEQGWVVDSEQYARDPERYNHAFADDPTLLPQASLIVPLFHQQELLGFARLINPARLGGLNYEDHDILKTVGRQVAAFLAHDLAKEQLAETRQFEAYSKLSAFVVHDLKNLLAQQALLVANAKRFKDRPEFFADVVTTVDSGVQRMRRLLQQLGQGSATPHQQRVEINNLVARAVAEAARGQGVVLNESSPIWVLAEPDRLSNVITHLVNNARQASPTGSEVKVTVAEANALAVIEICDRGEGMTEEFVRRRLFKPFDTTKGTSGMGIGAHQAREVLRSLGGDITVTSQVGVGTTVRVTLPVWKAPAAERPVSVSLPEAGLTRK